MMTRKHYVMLARVIERNAANSFDVFMLAHDLANELKNDNPRFDRAKFLEACGVSDD